MEKILQTEIPREKGMIYFVKGDPIAVYKTKPGRRKKNESTRKDE